MIPLFTGGDSKQWLANEVLRSSIIRRTQAKVDFHHLNLLDLETPLKIPTPAFSRFFIPYFQKYKGKAIYISSASLVFDDIEKLFNLSIDSKGALARPLDERGFATDVMVLDCEKLPHWKPEEWIAKCFYDPSLIFKTLSALPQSLNGQDFEPLPLEWNQIDQAPPGTKIIHFKNIGYPWLDSSHPLRPFFLKELRAGVEDQMISLKAILLEMQAGRIDTNLLKDMMAENP